MQLKNENWRETLLGLLARGGLIFCVLFLLALLSAFPFRIGGIDNIRPSFVLIAVYYWAIMRPETLSYGVTFLTGIALDLLAGFPLGLSALSLVAVQWVVSLQRKFLMGQAFRVMWAGLALVALGQGILQWAAIAAFDGGFPPIEPALASVLLTALCFPLAAPLLASFSRFLLEKDTPREF